MSWFFRLLNILLLAGLISTAHIYNKEIVEGVIMAKTIWVLLLTGILLLGSTYTTLTKPTSITLNHLDVLLIIYVFYGIVNSSLNDDLLFSSKNIESYSLLCFYFVSKRILKNNYHTETIWISFILLLTFITISIAILQLYYFIPSIHPRFSFTGFFENPAPYAIYLSILFIFCLTVVLNHPNKFFKYISTLLIVTSVIILVISMCRSAWIGLIAGGMWLIEQRFKTITRIFFGFQQRKVRIFILSTITVLGLCVACGLYLLKKSSADGRILIWKVSGNVFKNNVLKGVGPGRFSIEYLNYQAEYFQKRPERKKDEGRLAGYVSYAYNDLLQIAVERGLIGLILMVSILFAVFKASSRVIELNHWGKQYNRNILINFSQATLIVIVVSGLFSYSLTVLPIQIFFYVCLAFISANSIADSKPIIQLKKHLLLQKTALATTSLFAGIFLIGYSVIIYRAYSDWYQVDSTGYEGDDIEQLDPYNYLLNQNPRFVVMKGYNHAMRGEYVEAIQLYHEAKLRTSSPTIYFNLGYAYWQLKDFKNAERQYLFLESALPGLMQPKYILAKLYLLTNQKTKWEQQAQSILKFHPKIRSKFTDNMKKEIDSLYQKMVLNQFLSK